MITLKRLLIALFAIAAIALLVVGLGIANAETPAERCKRETTAYNNAWKNSWAASHPGKKPADAPPPPVPYKCGGNDGPPPTVTPTTSTPSEAPSSTLPPTTTQRSADDGPSMTSPTSRREIEHPNKTQRPISPSTEVEPSVRPEFRRTLCAKSVTKFVRSRDIDRSTFNCLTSIAEINNVKTGQKFLVNVVTDASREVTKMSAKDIDLTRSKISTSADAPISACTVTRSSNSSVTGRYGGNLEIHYCYGITKDGNVVYENGTRISYKLNLGSVTWQEMNYGWIMDKTHLITSFSISWRFRMDVKGGEDYNIENGYKSGGDRGEGSFALPTEGRGVYFIEHTQIKVSDPMMPQMIENNEKDEAPRFRCDGTNPCEFPNGKASSVHY